MSKPYIVYLAHSDGGFSEVRGEFYVPTERVARGVVRWYRDRIERVVAQPVEVYRTSYDVVEAFNKQNGWHDRPGINLEFRDSRLDEEQSYFWGKAAHPEIIR